MREIKFRGKTASGEWVYGDLVQRRLKNTVFIEHIEKDKHCLTTIIFETIGQYTGLKDKNGKEIFEGDIVDSNGLVAEIIYEQASFRFKWIDGRTEKVRNLGNEPAWSNIGIIFEVIGNIWENPELLEAQPNDR